MISLKIITRPADVAGEPVRSRRRQSTLPTNFEVAVAVVFIILLLLAVTLLGFSIQRSVTSRMESVAWQHEQVRLVLSLKNYLNETVIIPHDHLILGDNKSKQRFNNLTNRIDNLFNKIKASNNNKKMKITNLNLAREYYLELQKIEGEILSLPNPSDNISAVSLIKKMHLSQGKILQELDRFIREEKKLIDINEKAARVSERRAFMIIQALSVFMVAVVLIIAYIGRKNAW